ncbi:MAG: methyl-accepting chemotaxis protein [Arcobacteraceae bacterium]|nr:methyl-accepting chemotaxis protein [Arcobacteraceae bacterium]
MNMTFTQKLMSIIGILVTVAVVIAWTGLSGASSLNDRLDNVINKEAVKLVMVGKLDKFTQACRKDEKNMVLSKTNERVARYFEKEKESRAEMNKIIVALKPLLDSENQTKLDEMEAGLRNYDLFMEELNAASVKSLGTGSEAIAAQQKKEELSTVKGKEFGRAVSVIVEQMVKSNEANLQSISKKANEDYAALRNQSLAISIGGILFALVIAMIMIRQIMLSINSSVVGVNDAAEQVASAATQISDSSQQLAEGAQEQAASVEEVTSSLAQTKATVDQNSQNAREADMLSKDANDSAKLGYEHIQELTKSMNEINDSSRKIANIIKTIDEIAFQTNLLALNAAVEAARAGEHGLGFAVVAEEVRNLAQRSAEAAKNTAEIIEQSIEQVRKGNNITESTNKAFEDILDKVKKVGDITGEIALASKEQATGVQQITEAMNQVDQVTQTMASNSEESAAASEEMSAQAVQMKEQIAQVAAIFGIKVNSNGSNHTSGLTHHITMRPKGKATVAKRSASIQMKAKKPSEIMPLDEDDIKEF